MNQKNKPKERKIGKQIVEKKHLIDPRYKNLVYTVLIIVTIGIFFIINNTRSEPEQGPYPPNYLANAENNSLKAAEFTLPTTDGKQLKLSDYKGKVIILDFWATWCAPCRRGIPDLVDLKKSYKEKEFEVIGISLDQSNTIDEVIPFMKEFEINYPVVFGNMETVRDYGNISSIPTTFIVDKKGNIAASFVGLVEKSILEKEVKKLL